MSTLNGSREKTIRKALFAILAALTMVIAAPSVAQETAKRELGQHPRIAHAIRALHDAIEYMEHAPHDFGGQKAQAIADSRKAIEQLREAMKYRASADNAKKGKM